MLVEIDKAVDWTNTVYGVDWAPKMVQKAQRPVTAAGYNYAGGALAVVGRMLAARHRPKSATISR